MRTPRPILIPYGTSRLLAASAMLLVGCPTTSKDSGSGLDDTAGETSGETGGESGDETSGETDTGEKEVPCTGSVTGSVVTFEGAPASGVELQFCDSVCFPGNADSTGAFAFVDMCPGSYKLDALGYTLAGDLGWLRMHVELGEGEAFVVPDTLFLPEVDGPKSLASGSATFGGNVTILANLAGLTVPFGWGADEFWAGWVAGADVPEVWIAGVAGAVSMSPLGTTVSEPFQVAVSGSGLADGTYEVYTAAAHGELEGPVGSATVTGGALTSGDLSPTILSWLLFVPAA